MNISVIIPVYNAALLVEKAVSSALALEEVKEILLIEDKSTDNSLEICKNLVETYPDRVKLYQHEDKGNHGAGASRNLGLEKASQEFIAFLDADDYYLPNRFDAEKKLFGNPKIEGVFNAIGTDFITEKGKTEFQQKFKNTQLTTVKKHAEGSDVFYGLLGLEKKFGTFFHLNGLTIRKDTIKKNKLKFNEILNVHQDTDFIIKLSNCAFLKSGNITIPVAMRGVHDDNRITKIALHSRKYYEKQFLLWQSIFNWFKDKNIIKSYKEHIFLQYKALELSQLEGFKKIFTFIFVFTKNPKILKTRYRFIYFKK